MTTQRARELLGLDNFDDNEIEVFIAQSKQMSRKILKDLILKQVLENQKQ